MSFNGHNWNYSGPGRPNNGGRGPSSPAGHTRPVGYATSSIAPAQSNGQQAARGSNGGRPAAPRHEGQFARERAEFFSGDNVRAPPRQQQPAETSAAGNHPHHHNGALSDRLDQAENHAPEVFSVPGLDAVGEPSAQTVPDPGPPPNIQKKRKCTVCKDVKLGCMLCDTCLVDFCRACWPDFLLHQPGIVAKPHDPIDRELEDKLALILDPQIQEGDQEALIDEDEATAWFAVTKDELEDLVFRDLGRYGNIVSGLRRKAYPALVSFVGPTGSGKSALIKMLMELNFLGTQPYETPVVKSAKCFSSIPTSGDVHLFCDPHTCKSDAERPILYADCEGLEGGERTPLGSRTRRLDKLQKRISGLMPGANQEAKTSFPRWDRITQQTSKRKVKWANTDRTKRREFIVSELYPRILYPFSDVVVFVLRVTNMLEGVIEKLLKWATAALETSSNQPVLPYAIIAMNSLPNDAGVVDPFWSTDRATEDILGKEDGSTLGEASDGFYQNPKFQPFIKCWRDRGVRVRSVRGLLNLYYSGVRVVRIPQKGRSSLIQTQISGLYKEIKIGIQQSHEMKRERRMLMNTAMLQRHLQSAYDHFSNNLEAPFDFVRSTFEHSPIPSDFGGNILKLILSIRKQSSVQGNGYSSLRMVAPMIASCIMLDAVRQQIAGSALDILPEYMPSCKDAFQTFFDKHLECEYSDPADSNIRCVNSRVGHNTKGHQDSNGKIISAGKYYVTSLTEEHFELFQKSIKKHLVLIEHKLKSKLRGNEERYDEAERIAISNIHRDDYMIPFYTSVGGPEHFISHSACFVCLVHSAEHHLQCGHVICTPCLQTYGNPGPGRIAISCCPMHLGDQVFCRPQFVAIKPPSAGVRLLSLDGGGVRGLTQLIMLEYLENALGSGLRLTSFFDLIVGTGTGAHIALGLAVNDWPIAECIKMFKILCREAFAPRMWGNFPGIQQFINGKSVKYKTHPLQTALKAAFSSDDPLFSGTGVSSRPLPKVAVTTSSSVGKAIVLGNYNRGDDGKAEYEFPRCERPDDEFKTWEAAWATCAAPGYLKEFSRVASKDVYLGGGIYHANPIYVANSERKLIWPEVGHLPPDFVLSLGSGYNPKPKERKPKKFRSRGVALFTEMLHWKATDHIESSAASEATWNNWLNTVCPNPDLAQGTEDRYVRLNVKFEGDGDPPHLDDLKSFQRIEDETRKQFRFRGKQMKLLADHLICSTFYFKPDDAPSLGDMSEAYCKGSIICRFSPHSDEVVNLGKFFRTLNDKRGLDPSWKPYFTVREKLPGHGLENQQPRGERPENEHVPRIYISEETTSQMVTLGNFELPQVEFFVSSREAVIEISLCLDGDSEFPISGSPCQILMNIQNGMPFGNLSWRRARAASPRESAPTSPTSDRGETVKKPSMRNLAASILRPRTVPPDDAFELSANGNGIAEM
ncbi:hypothetical protein TWF281_002858 [Arthrobotrys megalospora]